MLAVKWLERFWNSVGIPENTVVMSAAPHVDAKLLDLRANLLS